MNRVFGPSFVAIALMSYMWVGTTAPGSVLSRKMLVDVLGKLAINRGRTPLPVEDESVGHGSRRARFMRRLDHHSYDDLFRPAKVKSSEFVNYNLLNQRNRSQRRSDDVNGMTQECHVVYTKDRGQHFVSRKLRFYNRVPRGYDEAWSFRFCMGRDKLADQQRILYFFHGVTGSPKNFVHRQAIARMREIWRGKGRLPVWVSVSLGRAGVLGEAGMERRFMDIVVPYVESRLGFKEQSPRQRFIMGVSMGGANATHLVLKRPKFSAAAFLVCPAVAALDANASHYDVWRYARRTGGVYGLIQAAYVFRPYEFSDRAYLDSVDPLIAGQRHFSRRTPPMYIQTSNKDQFGFNEGGKLLAMVARTRGVEVTFEELEGRHCVVEPRAAVSFFLNHRR